MKIKKTVDMIKKKKLKKKKKKKVVRNLYNRYCKLCERRRLSTLYQFKALNIELWICRKCALSIKNNYYLSKKKVIKN